MSASESKKERILGLFYRLMCGERISPKMTALEYGVSIKSITRDINEIKNFLSDSREIVGNAELTYLSGKRLTAWSWSMSFIKRVIVYHEDFVREPIC